MSSNEANIASTSTNEDDINPEDYLHISLRTDKTSDVIDENKQTEESETDIETETKSDEGEIILCTLWRSSKLGVAYFSTIDSDLHIIYDILDLAPEFVIMKQLYYQLQPMHTITIGNLSSQFVTALSLFGQNSDSETTVSLSDCKTNSSLPSNIQLLKNDEYSYELCLHTLQSLRLPNELENMTDTERLIYINSLVDFNKTVAVQALGTLILYLNKNKGLFQTNNLNSDYLFNNIHTVAVKDVVFMDESTYRYLNIFSISEHPAAFKRGTESSNKEGNSIFKLFNRCKSSIGCANLKALLMHPTNNINILKKRLDFIEFSIKPINSGIVTGIKDCMKHIFNITTTLRKIHGNQATITNWKILYATLHNIFLINQMCVPYADQIEIFCDLNNNIDEAVTTIANEIFHKIDFQTSYKRNITINVGIDEKLDDMKRFRNDIKDKITLAAKYEIHNLPSFIKQCTMTYIPKIGYLVAITKWDDDAEPTELEQYGFRFMFTLGTLFNYKSSICDTLDDCLGDIYTEILSYEKEVVGHLAENVLKRAAVLKKPIKFVAQLDSLLCLAQIAKEHGYVRPNLSTNNIINIKNGRHPLLELNITGFVPNSLKSGCENPRLKIITGPNDSGKTIFLRQTGLIVYLVHIGSFVPAQNATIGMMYSINTCTGICANESSSMSISTFVCDINQISNAQCISRENSLIIIDEFGRSTSELEGLTLLTSYLEHILVRQQRCPHILVSTHFTQLTKLIEEDGKFVEHLKFDSKIDQDNLIFLYKITKGVAESCTSFIARRQKIPEDVIRRAKEIFHCFTEGQSLLPI